MLHLQIFRHKPVSTPGLWKYLGEFEPEPVANEARKHTQV
jgi:hypothetical protein